MTEAEKLRWFRQVSKSITARCLDTGANLQWLQKQILSGHLQRHFLIVDPQYLSTVVRVGMGNVQMELESTRAQ